MVYGIFDSAFSCNFLEKLSTEHIYLKLKGIKRMLLKGGYLIKIAILNKNVLDNQVSCLDYGKGFHGWCHLQSFTKVRLGEVFSG